MTLQVCSNGKTNKIKNNNNWKLNKKMCWLVKWVICVNFKL